MATLEERFEAKVDRSGDHHIWTGAQRANGTGFLKVAGKPVTAQRVAWELAYGELPSGASVKGCPDMKSCVRVEHLAVHGQAAQSSAPKRRAPSGAGSKRQVRSGVWELSVTRGTYEDGTPRREFRTIEADSEDEAEREKAVFVAEVHRTPAPERRSDRDITLDEAVERYLEEHLRNELGREERTVYAYRRIHRYWFAPKIGGRRLRDIDEATMDERFGAMRVAGLSKARMNKAKSLYQPMFRWARQRRMIPRSPMADFRVGKSLYKPTRRALPEVDQLCRYLVAAVEHVPEIAPVLATEATTGMRLGEVVAIRRSRLLPDANEIKIDLAADVRGVKGTKTDEDRIVPVDRATMDMLLKHCQNMDERAAAAGVEVGADGFVFSLKSDCSERMSAEWASKRIGVLKEHLGIANKHPEVIAREDEALRLFRQKEPDQGRQGRRGPVPKGGMSYSEIGQRLGRSHRWAAMAVASAQRRETANDAGMKEVFDGSAIALRAFTSTELLEAGFDVAAIANRQGHSPEVLLKHYARPRPSASRRAADHLGRLVHQKHPSRTELEGPSL